MTIVQSSQVITVIIRDQVIHSNHHTDGHRIHGYH